MIAVKGASTAPPLSTKTKKILAHCRHSAASRLTRPYKSYSLLDLDRHSTADAPPRSLKSTTQHQDTHSHTTTTMTSAVGPISTAADGTNEDYFASYEDVEVTNTG